MCAHDVAHDGEPEPGSVTGRLGRHPWIEQPVDDLGAECRVPCRRPRRGPPSRRQRLRSTACRRRASRRGVGDQVEQRHLLVSADPRARGSPRCGSAASSRRRRRSPHRAQPRRSRVCAPVPGQALAGAHAPRRFRVAGVSGGLSGASARRRSSCSATSRSTSCGSSTPRAGALTNPYRGQRRSRCWRESPVTPPTTSLRGPARPRRRRRRCPPPTD